MFRKECRRLSVNFQSLHLMNCLTQFAALLPLLVAAQPVAPLPGVYRPLEDASAIAAGPDQPGVVAFNAADLLARKNLVGVWQATYFEHNGESRPDVAAGLQMKFSRGRLELMQRGRPTIVVAYSVNPTKSPTGFLWKLSSPDTIAFQDGIYVQDGDTLVICLAAINSPAASQFLTQPNDGRSLFVLRRTSN